MYKSLFMFVALLCTVVQGMWVQTGVNTEEALTAAVASGGSGQLTGDITLSNRLNIASGKTVTLDLQGRRLSGQPTAKGLYIHNGKKIVVK